MLLTMKSIYKTFAGIHIAVGIILTIPAADMFAKFPVLAGLCLFYIGIGVRLWKFGASNKAHILKVQKVLLSIGLLVGFYGMFSLQMSAKHAGMVSETGQLIVALSLLMVALAGLTMYYVGYQSEL